MVDPATGIPPGQLHLATGALGAAQVRELKRGKESADRQRNQVFDRDLQRAITAAKTQITPGEHLSKARDSITTDHTAGRKRATQKPVSKIDASKQGRRKHPRHAPGPDHEKGDSVETGNRKTLPIEGTNWFDLFA